ncbi:MAG: 2-oxoacid:acceptor oxidoreductase family protein [Dehalococcoidales bacterium]|nr:2-oxoacid:acceptor oxidoreductase family protein [Dehalococcoidales bacterium]
MRAFESLQGHFDIADVAKNARRIWVNIERGGKVIETIDLIEIRWHGRGGQGAVTSAELLAQAAIAEGKYAQGFPSFGPERRGAPVLAFNRISAQKPIRNRAGIVAPDVVVVLDSSLLRVVDITSGLNEEGIIILNTKRPPGEIKAELGGKWRLATVDATKIARETLGISVVNTAMFGALLKATQAIEMESLFEPLRHRFSLLGERNIEAMKRAHNETTILAKD